MSQLSQNLEKIIQMISIEQLLGLVKQNTDNKSNSDIMNLPIVQKVVKAYEDEIQVLQTPASSSSSSCEKDYSVDIAKINEQLASINNNLLQLTEAIRNINISTKEVKREELVVDENVVVEESLEEEKVVVEVASLEEEHVRLKIEEKQEVISKAESELEEEEESSAAEEEEEEESVSETVAEEESSVAEEVAEIEEEEEESEKEISDEESIASSNVVEEEEEESEVISAAADEEEEEEEEEVFEIEIDDVTYYATSEENGILYEVDADGEVGKKVGIIKDGEPIFI